MVKFGTLVRSVFVRSKNLAFQKDVKNTFYRSQYFLANRTTLVCLVLKDAGIPTPMTDFEPACCPWTPAIYVFS